MPVPDFSPGEVLTAAAMDSIGLWLVKTQTVGTGVSTVTVTDAFSADYDNYKIVVSGVDAAGVGSAFNFQLTNQTTGVYTWSYSLGTHGGNAFANAGNTGTTTALVGLSGDQDDIFTVIEVSNPFISNRRAVWSALGASSVYRWSCGGATTATASNTGFSLSCASALTGGTIRVYGYRN
jgi:hypothetical protein